jgi:hypothetical protein
MRNDLITDREFFVEGTWYAPLERLRQFKSVVYATHLNTTSSAGDWDGFFIQRIGRHFHVIPFYQENACPLHGFKFYTGEVLFIEKDLELTMEEINRITELVSFYYEL